MRSPVATARNCASNALRCCAHRRAPASSARSSACRRPDRRHANSIKPLSMLNPRLHDQANELATRFGKREPFRHVVIDDFFAPAYCAQLLAQFPAFERGNARSEDGSLGNKSTVEKIRGLGPAFGALDDLVKSGEFLALIGRVTGIPDLLYDPWYFGGGTHENRNGQDLDAHVDFNRHPVEKWHRRLNLIVYLNHEWNDTWGG